MGFGVWGLEFDVYTVNYGGLIKIQITQMKLTVRPYAVKFGQVTLQHWREQILGDPPSGQGFGGYHSPLCDDFEELFPFDGFGDVVIHSGLC